ncbi:MAG TPA: xanthine dehydrogenase family protein molybdopterin-binding subunit [Herpetosiphonaceae bacterium]
MTTQIGASLPRPDALGKVTGAARYPGDLVRPDMLHLKVVFAHRPHARILSIDTGAALAEPGVVAVLTAADVPFNAFGLIEADQPVLCGDVVRFEGDKVALVVAETAEAAAAGARLVAVEYQDLPLVCDPRQALDPASPLVHAGRGSNLVMHVPIRKGDTTKALAEADVVLDGEFSTSWQEHAFLQPEAGIAYIDEQDRVVVETAGQWLHEDRRQIAEMLRLPQEQVVIRYAAIGGAFGGREDLSIQHILALAAWKLRRPVALVWSREESMIGHHKRHPIDIRCRWGATSDGRITAVEAEVIADGGAYASTSQEVIKIAALFASGCYEVPNISVDGYAVFTNNIPSGAFRGFGAPQAQFASEIMITRLAQALHLDPIELRRRNIYREGSIEPTQNLVPPGVSALPVLERCVEEMKSRIGEPRTGALWANLEPNGEQRTKEQTENLEPRTQNLESGDERTKYREAQDSSLPPAPAAAGEGGAGGEGLTTPGLPPHIRRGVGIACGIKNIGYSFGYPEQATATVELIGGAEIEHAHVRVGAADVGQGIHLALRQIASEMLRLPLEKITMITDDSSQAPNAGSASASRLTYMAGRAVHDAAQAALVQWADEERPAVATIQYRAPATTPLDPVTTAGRPNYAYGYAAQAVEVEVNTLTGQVQVHKIISVHDVGKAINRQQVEGQIEGCVAQALGYALLEHFQVRNGHVLTPHFSTYLLPTTMDVPPEIVPVIMELADPNGPYGARGMAEMPLVPLAPAIASAIYDATGVWVTQQPMTPERVLTALAAQPSAVEVALAEQPVPAE